MDEDEPLCKLALWQFSLSYDELPFREGVREYTNNGIYRSKRSSYVYVYHDPGVWDCYVPG